MQAFTGDRMPGMPPNQQCEHALRLFKTVTQHQNFPLVTVLNNL